MHRTRNASWVAGLLLAASLSFGQSPAAQLDTAAADAAYQAKDWAKAGQLYEQLSQASPAMPRIWFRLGVCRQRTGQHQAALEAFQKAQGLGVPARIVGYELAAVYASLGQTDKAMEQLSEAVKQGFSQPEQMTSDPDLQSIRSDARFGALLEQARHNQTPCTYSSESRQFDFWVGDWDVMATRDGAPAGTSHIERILGDCVIWENWSSLGSSYSGKSYNTYNANLKRWEQFWVDNVGGMVHFYGGLKDGIMDFYTDDVPQADGTKLRRHLQFFNLGKDKLRQFSQKSTDGGKTWTVEYDLTYKRKK
jgi:tetratricopeptide (TPR) repeat protein